VRYLDLPDRQDLRKLQQLREEQGELSAADERRLKTLLVGLVAQAPVWQNQNINMLFTWLYAWSLAETPSVTVPGE